MFSNRQEAFKALNSTQIASKLIWDNECALKELLQSKIPGHAGHPETEIRCKQTKG